jgi:peptide/nickel transport system substrate-binding protein
MSEGEMKPLNLSNEERAELRMHLLSRKDMLIRSGIVAVGLAGSGWLLAACGSSGSDGSSAATDTAAATTAKPAPDTIVYTMAGPAEAINPGGPAQNSLPSVAVFLACYEGLTNYRWYNTVDELLPVLEEGGNAALVESALVESFETSADGKVWTFKIRPGVVSNAGNTMTVEDVKWSFEKAFADKGTASFFIGVIGGFGAMEQFAVVDDTTFTITQAAPNGLLALSMGFGWPVIYDSTEVKKNVTDKDPFGNTWLNQNTAGFGPYSVTGAGYGNGGAEVTLVRNDNYWGEAPPVATIVQKGVADASSRLQLLIAGESSYAGELTPKQFDEASKAEGISVTHIDDTTTAYLALTFDGKWGDPKVRQAIARALPYDDILSSVFLGRAKPYKSILLPFQPGYTEEFWAYQTDVEAAKAVLSTVGEPLVLSYAEGLPVDEQLAIITQTALAAAGLEVKLDKQPRAQFDGKKYGRTGDLQAFIDNLDAPGIVTADYYFYSFGGEAGYFNFFGWNDPALLPIIGGSVDPDATISAKAIADGQKLYMEQLPIIPIAWTGKDHAHSSNVSITLSNTANGLLRWNQFGVTG